MVAILSRPQCVKGTPVQYIKGDYVIQAHNKVYGINMGPTWDPSDPGGLHVGLRNFVICSFSFVTIPGQEINDSETIPFPLCVTAAAN